LGVIERIRKERGRCPFVAFVSAAADWYAGKMSANFGLKRYDQAIEPARQAIAINPNYIFYAHTTLGGARLDRHAAEQAA
jgi:tetratricopeptide (TPR) repeat protein